MEPVVVHPLTLPDLLMELLAEASQSPATLVICLSRTSFIRLLLTSLPINHPLLTATLDILQSSSTISLLFCDTAQTLQAYLATIQQCSGPLYLVYPLRLHMHTPAFSAQGLSRTFANFSDAVAATGVKAYVVEPAEGLEGEEDPWQQHVPILGSGGKFPGHRGWVGRTVGVDRIVGRWCRFQRAGQAMMYAGDG